MKAAAKKPVFAHYKKWWIGGAIGVLVLLLLGLIGGSLFAWQDYEGQSQAWQQQVRRQVDATFALKGSTVDERSKKLEALQKVRDEIERGPGYCRRYAILHWEQFIPEVKVRLDRCSVTIAKVGGFGGALGPVTSFLKGEQEIMKIIKDIKTADSIDESQWQSMADSWAAANEKLQKLEVPAELKDVKSVAVDRIKDIHAAWLALISVNQTKDRQKYETSVDQIGAAYASFPQVTDSAAKSFKVLTDKIEVAYKRAFS